MNENENKTSKLWEIAKTMQRGKFIAINAYIKKQERPKVNKPTLQFKKIEKKKKNKLDPKFAEGKK